jgi:hypothetical protein
MSTKVPAWRKSINRALTLNASSRVTVRLTFDMMTCYHNTLAASLRGNECNSSKCVATNLLLARLITNITSAACKICSFLCTPPPERPPTRPSLPQVDAISHLTRARANAQRKYARLPGRPGMGTASAQTPDSFSSGLHNLCGGRPRLHRHGTVRRARVAASR